MIAVRPMMSEDVTDACRILNDIIAAGGTTAFEIPFSDALFAQSYLNGADKICCHVALDDQGRSVKLQTATVGTLALVSNVSVRKRGVWLAIFVINYSQHNHHFCSVSLVEVQETLENLTTLCLCS